MTATAPYEAIVQTRYQALEHLVNSQRRLIGYIYPHAPLELLLAHELTPTLLWAHPQVSSAYEASLQTFCCAYCRNIFSQRTKEHLPPLAGLIFPRGTCDSLQNLGDIWRARFPNDVVFQLTYPVTTLDNSNIQYLTEELRRLSQNLETALNIPFSKRLFDEAATLIAQFHTTAQIIATTRIIDPAAISYSEYARLVRNFLTSPDLDNLTYLEETAATLRDKLREKQLGPIVEALRYALLQQRLNDIKITPLESGPRLAVIGGMVDPEAIAILLEATNAVFDEVSAEIVLDLLSFSYRTVFTPNTSLQGDSFEEMARTILQAPTEPTQEGLPSRLHFLEQILTHLKINGLIIAEQSFCDPDQFELPAIESVTKKTRIPTLRLQLDPELSDRSRLEGKFQTFIETLLPRL